MKKSNVFGAAALAVAMGGTLLFAADMSSKPVTAEGWISDTKCGAAHMGGASAEACLKKCAAHGEKPVFVDQADKTVWTIDNPSEVAKHLGHHVSIMAKEDASTKTMHVTKVTMMASQDAAPAK